MKNQKISKFIRLISFVLISALLFAGTSFAFERKTNITKMKEFYSLEENSLDYICLGSSHAYCTVNPLEVWNKSGLRGFVLAPQCQPLEATYHYVVEAFKTQSPKYVFLEGYMAKNVLSDASEAVLYDAIDPLNLSSNKIAMINRLTSGDEYEPYLFNILKYHTRWKELINNGAKNFLHQPIDTYKGYNAFIGTEARTVRESNYDLAEPVAIPKDNLEMYNKILKLVKENHAELILMIAPYHETDDKRIVGIMKSQHIWAEENGVKVIDYSGLLDEIGINTTDYYDSGHLDVSGAKKTSSHLADYLLEIGLKKSPSPMDEIYKRDYEAFVKKYPEQ